MENEAPVIVDDEFEEPTVEWPVVRSGKELNVWEESKLVLEHMTINRVLDKHLPRAVGDIVGRVHSFLPSIPPKLVTVTGTKSTEFSLSFIFDFPPEDGCKIFNGDFSICNPHFEGERGSCFWIMTDKYGETREFMTNRHGETREYFLMKLMTRHGVRRRAIVPDMDLLENHRQSVDVMVKQSISLFAFPLYFNIISNWRQWIPTEVLGDNGEWTFSLNRDDPNSRRFMPVDVDVDPNARQFMDDFPEYDGQPRYDLPPRHYGEFKFVQFHRDGSWYWYCFAATNASLGQFKAGLALVPPEDVAALDLERAPGFDSGALYTLFP